MGWQRPQINWEQSQIHYTFSHIYWISIAVRTNKQFRSLPYLHLCLLGLKSDCTRDLKIRDICSGTWQQFINHKQTHYSPLLTHWSFKLPVMEICLWKDIKKEWKFFSWLLLTWTKIGWILTCFASPTWTWSFCFSSYMFLKREITSSFSFCSFRGLNFCNWKHRKQSNYTFVYQLANIYSFHLSL